jgi:hypothetical protein
VARRLVLHDDTQNPIDARLVASAMAFEPCQYVGIEADRQLLLRRRPCNRDLLEKAFVKRRNVRIVDIAIARAVNV